MTHIRKTPEGVVITTGRVTTFATILGILVLLGGFVVGAVQFYTRAASAVQRTEFVEYSTRDSILHAGQAMHSAFLDTVVAKQGRDAHALGCYIAKYPFSLCNDVIPLGRTP